MAIITDQNEINGFNNYVAAQNSSANQQQPSSPAQPNGQPQSPSSPAPSFLSQLANSPAVSAVNDFGGQFAHGAMQGLNNIATFMPNVMGYNANVKAPTAPFVNPNDHYASSFGTATQYAMPSLLLGGAGLALAPGSTAAGVLGNLSSSPFSQGALSGLLATGGNLATRDVAGAIGGISAGLLGGIPNQAGGLVGGVVNRITGNTGVDPEALAANAINSTVQGRTVDQLGNGLFSQVLQNARANKTYNSNVFSNVSDQVQQRGYATADSAVPSPLISKLISPDPVLKQSLGDLADANPGYEFNKPVQTYLDNPTYDNAHILQSQLGKTGAELTSYGSSNADRTLGNSLFNMRQGVISNILDKFIQNGDSDLAQQYKMGANDYVANVLPYNQIAPIRNALAGKAYPSNITGLLSKVSEPTSVTDIYGNQNTIPGSYETVRQQLLSNPDSANDLIGLHFAKNVKQIAPTADSPTPMTNQVLSTVSKMNSNFAPFQPENFQSQMRQLRQAQVAQNVPKQGNTMLGAIAGHLLGGGYHLVKKMLEG